MTSRLVKNQQGFSSHLFGRALVAIVFMLIGWLPSLAQDFEVDDIHYYIISSNEVVVYSKDNDPYSTNNKYIGNVVIPSSVDYNGTTYSVTSIYDYAFYNCIGLTSIVIPNSVTSIGDVAFSGCSSLTSIEIPNSVTSIRGDAFSWCTSLTSIEIPNSVTSIGDLAFSGCSSLTSIVVDAGNTKYDSRNDCNAIIETASNTLIAGCQNTIIPNSVTSIGDWAFCGCTSLASIEIPNSVTSIGGSAFRGCTGLTSIEIPNSVTSIGNSAFCGCSGLTSIEIGNSVTSIGDYAFTSCTSLTSIEIPNNVTSIGDGAFYDCSRLTKITCLATNPPTIDYSTFHSYSAELYVPKGCISAYQSANFWKKFSNIIELEPELEEGMAFEYGGLTYKVTVKGKELAVIASESGEYSGAVVIPSSVNYNGTTYSVTSIGCEAFAYCNSLTSVVIGNSVTSIGERAFYVCSNLTIIEIPNSVTSIGRSAFEGCSGLTIIEIPNSVTIIGYEAFSWCTSLTSIEIPNSVTSIGNSAFEGCSSLTSIEIPNSVTNIGGQAFQSCSSLTSVVIGNSVTSIGDYAFLNCSSLTSIEIGNSVTSIGNQAFQSCSSLTSIEIPNSVTSIGWSAFSSCSSLTSIEIGNSVTSIGKSAFNSCSSLTSIQIPNSVTSIGNDAFVFCSSLTSIVVDSGNTKYDSRNGCNAIIETASNTLIAGCQNTIIPNSVTSIGNSAFCGCSSLTSIEIPNSVTSIGEGAFRLCTSLTGIEIPNSVTSIEGNAFYDCTSLTKITCLATNPPTIEFNTFNSYSAQLYVPAGCISAYQYAKYWKNFNIKEIPTLSTSIALNQTTTTLKASETITLIATILPENATDKSVEWSSSDESVATIDANGLVTAIAVGEAIITVTTVDGSNLTASCKVSVVPTLAESITLDKTEINLEATETATLIVTVLPELTTDKSVEWTSSDETVAIVDENGVVTAVAVGEAIITAATADGSNLSATCKVTVVPTLATSITLDKTEYEIAEKSDFQLVATVLPELATDKGVVWSSSDKWVASVNENGLVTAYSVGEATITATTTDGSDLSASCKVTVVPTLAESITLDKIEISLEATETATLLVTVLPELTTDKSVEWSSSDESVATIDANGLVTAIAVGEATITATTADGSNLTASCKVTVVPTLAETITLDKTEISLEATETATLIAIVLPELVTDKSVEWSSSNESVAVVDENGVVTAVAVGEATITATTVDDSNLSATCKVTVIPTLVVSIELDQTEASVEEKSDLQLTATILPEHATNKEVAWSSSDKWVATVDNTGLVTIHSAGEVIITATTTDGTNLSATCRINVYSGIDGVNGDDVIVATIGDNIVVKNAQLGSNVRVFAADGAMIASEVATDSDVVIEAPVKGIYIVAIDCKSFKVMVK